ncbi:hypothetical protein JTB14_007102 [Gonioctena quinquepunctata]|nr:hypothetical protein JTB14_007102 [Gonioctena quinquepunctata]
MERTNLPFYKTKEDSIELLPDDVREATEVFTMKIMGAVRNAIPQTGGISGKKSVPWWNNEIASTISMKNEALNGSKRNLSLENMTAFEKARATSRRLIRESKRKNLGRLP